MLQDKMKFIRMSAYEYKYLKLRQTCPLICHSSLIERESSRIRCYLLILITLNMELI